MGIYIEAIILYIVLFFSGSAAQITGGTVQATAFSAPAEIYKIILYCIPSLALIWYLLIRSWKLEYWVVKPGRKDLISGLITFPCLLVIGITIAFISLYVGAAAGQSAFFSPSTASDWIILSLSCFFIAYLEESFFRFYLLNKRKEMNLSSASALTLSVALFSVCHIYEGPWGFLNAAISGTLLGFMYLRYNSLHGIAIAHGLYNICVYILNALIN